MTLSYVVAMTNIQTGEVKYFAQFDPLGNVITNRSVFSAFNFGVDMSSARYVRNHVLRELTQTGESRDFHINVLDVYLNSDETYSGIQSQER